MAHQNPYGGAPRIGSGTEGEPNAPGGDVSVFGGAPATYPINANRGNRQLNRQPGDVYPEVYGGAPPIGKGQSNKVPGGSGTDTSKGSTTIIP